MKELEKNISETTELHATKPIKKELKYIGHVKLHKGQKMWEMDLATRIIKEVEYDEVAATFSFGDETAINRKIITKENCLYASAINVKNADKKFFKLLGLRYPKNYKPKAK